MMISLLPLHLQANVENLRDEAIVIVVHLGFFPIHSAIPTYHIAGKFGEVFNLENWRICRKSPNLKLPNIAILRYAYVIDIGRRQIQNSPIHMTALYVQKTNSPNLMLAKFSRYTVIDATWATGKHKLCWPRV